MATVTFLGKPVALIGDLPTVGDEAPGFTLVDDQLENRSLNDFAGKKVLLNIVPSLDTPTCATSTRKFNESFSRRSDAVALVISADLPFAQARFCTTENIENVIPLSMLRDKQVAKDYGVLIMDGPLAGLAARAVVVIDENGVVTHTQLVADIADEPDYEAALKALD